MFPGLDHAWFAWNLDIIAPFARAVVRIDSEFVNHMGEVLLLILDEVVVLLFLPDNPVH